MVTTRFLEPSKRKDLVTHVAETLFKSAYNIEWDSLDEDDKDKWRESVQTTIRTLDEAGWQLVPKELTGDIFRASNQLLLSLEQADWEVLLEAAPKLLEGE